MEKEQQICCQGGPDSEGHPKIYLTLDPISHSATCPYCGKKFL
jgi:uncharacterized Zn-finger protein